MVQCSSGRCSLRGKFKFKFNRTVQVIAGRLVENMARIGLVRRRYENGTACGAVNGARPFIYALAVRG